MLTSLALILLVGLGAAGVFDALHLPRIIGMLLTGILLGPCVLNALDPAILGISAELRQMALVIILLKAGLSLDLRDLRRVGRPAVCMSCLPAGCEIAGYVLLAPALLGVTRIEAAVLGAVMGAVSPAVVVPRMVRLMEEKRGTSKSIPQLILAGASCDDVFVIVLFSAFVRMDQGGQARGRTLRGSMKVILVLGCAFLLLSIETWVKPWVALSGLLAVVSMACVLKRRCPEPVSRRLGEKFGKLWLAAEVVLFVLVGAAVDIRYTLRAGPGSVGMILLALCFRAAGVLLCLVKTPLRARERLFCVLAYLPKATVQAAIGSVPLSLGLPCGDMVLSTAVLGILITAPLGAFAID